MSLNLNDEGASPVFAELLLVAITVILATIIIAYMAGLIGHTPKGKIVVVSAEQVRSDQIDITYQGGEDSDKLDHFIIVTPNGDRVSWKPTVGQVYQLYSGGEDWSGMDHLVVVAYFYQGSEAQVVLDTYL